MTQNDAERRDEMSGEVIDGETGKPLATPRQIKLSDLRDVRLELAHVYREMDAGNLKSQEGTRRAYVLKTIHDVIVSAELEKRLCELEERAGMVPGSRGIPNARRIN